MSRIKMKYQPRQFMTHIVDSREQLASGRMLDMKAKAMQLSRMCWHFGTFFDLEIPRLAADGDRRLKPSLWRQLPNISPVRPD
jgi:hypothetical protein